MGIVTDIQRIGAPERSLDNLERRTLKAGEEMGELAEAVLSLTSASKGKGKRYMDMVEEAADVVIMGLDIALTKPPGMEETMTDEMWRSVVKKIIGLKLEKWRKQVERKGTLVAPGEIEFDEHELDMYLDSGEPDEVVEPTPITGPFGPLKGCGRHMGNPIRCGWGILCEDCKILKARELVAAADSNEQVDPTIEPMNDREQFLWDQCSALHLFDHEKSILEEMYPGWGDKQDAALKAFRQRTIAELRRTRVIVERDDLDAADRVMSKRNQRLID